MNPEIEKLQRLVLLLHINNNKTNKKLDAFLEQLNKSIEESLLKVENLSDENIKKLEEMVAEIKKENEEISDSVTEQKSEIQTIFNEKIQEIDTILEQVKNIKPKDGKDADETKIVQEVLSKITLPSEEELTSAVLDKIVFPEFPEIPKVVLDNGEQIVDKINTSNGLIKGDRIENFSNYTDEIKTLQNRTQLLLQISTQRANQSTGSNSFTTISVPAGTNPVADSATDTLTFTRTEETITITGTAASDTINFHVPGALVHPIDSTNTFEYANIPVGITAGATLNTSIGTGSLAALTSGGNNTVYGVGAGELIDTGGGNTLVGIVAGNSITSGGGNTAIGFGAGIGITTGERNLALAKGSLGAIGAGSTNTALGFEAMSSSMGDSNIALGANAFSAGLGNLVIAIGFASMGGANDGLTNAIGIGGGTGVNASTNTDIILMGQGADPSTDSSTGEFAVGGAENPITRYWFGNGGLALAAPNNITMSPTYGADANSAGADFTITAGNGTGSGGSGDFIIQTAPVAGASSTPNTMADVFRARANGNIFINNKLSLGTEDTMTINGSVVTSNFAINSGVLAVAEINTASATAGFGANIYGARSRGTIGTPTVVSSGDTLFAMTGVGYDGTDFGTAAQIAFQVDGTPGSNDMPGRIVFYTSPDGSQTLTEALRIANTGIATFAQTIVASSTIELGHATDTTLSRVSAGVIAVEGVTIPTISSTSTLTNKRITKRVVTTTDDATAVIDVDVTDVYELSAVANATTFTVTGTPTDGQQIVVRFKDAGVAKALTWTGFTAIGVTLPTTTVASKWCYVGITYNSAAATWHAIAVSQEV